jgi:peroxiredoxin
MNKKKIENVKTFSDLNSKSWFRDGDNIKVGDSFQKIMSGDSLTLEPKEILVGDTYQTFTIVITKDEKIHLLKSSRELK